MSVKNGSRVRHHPERANTRLKALDHWLGIPLVLFLGTIRKRRRRASSAPQRIACLHTAAIGDTVLSSALIQDLRQAYPATEIVYFTGASNYEAACLIPNIDSVVSLPVKDVVAAIRAVRSAGQFDLWFDLGPWPRLNALLSWSARTRFTVGFRTRGQHRHYAYDLSVDHRSDRHEVDNYRAMLLAAGIPAGRSFPRLNSGTCDRYPPGIVVHLFPGGSRSFLKEWPIEHWVELIDRLVADGYPVILTGTAANREQAQQVRDRLIGRERVNVAAGSLDLAATAGLLAGSRLVISVDTGIMHMASALGCRLVALHGPTTPERWGPLSEHAVAVSAREHCSPCLSLGFESDCARPDCMLHISVNDVYRTARTLLGR